MLRAAFTLLRLRHVQTPCIVGVRRLCSFSEGGASPNLNPDGYLYSESDARELFETWCNKYFKTYSSEEEKLFRFGRFRETLEWCNRENQKIDNPNLYYGTYEHADQTEEEYLIRSGGWGPCFCPEDAAEEDKA
ncbi:uncharacterized protein LOC130739365 [Lotus japonicus]|uniref:uncharacterized protein LOC130739365 n=1 Tax=Lotus japonicus TaxID=34305 RepID=UPI00258D208A|nr:uncharacterized protein LOC130739365 [Lotus japonicus]